MKSLQWINDAFVQALLLSQRENEIAENILAKLPECVSATAEQAGLTLSPENVWQIVNAAGPMLRDVISDTFGASEIRKLLSR